jgi:hypothetical protein
MARNTCDDHHACGRCLPQVSPGNMRVRGPPRWVVLPDSSFRTRWIQCQLVIAMYIIWVTPVRVGFDLPAQGTWFWVEGLIDIFFYADLIMNFFTAYEVGGRCLQLVHHGVQHGRHQMHVHPITHISVQRSIS